MGVLNATGKILDHLYSAEFVGQMRQARERLDEVEVDHTSVKPVVKIVGEFWAQLTEGDGNFNMFRFLEAEGAQVHVDSIGGWISYLLHQARIGMEAKKGLDDPYPRGPLVAVRQAAGQRVEVSPQVVAVALERSAVELSVCAHRPSPGRHYASLVLAARAGASGASLSITPWRAAARGISRWARTSTTPRGDYATWCWR
jgi:hypothetical protein